MPDLPVIEGWIERELGLRPGSERVLEAAGRLLRRRLPGGRSLPAAVELDPEVREALVRILTSSHTLFFRDRRQLEAIAETIAARVDEHGRPARVWSAGCSTGEEPYSLAALCRDAGVPVHITATDISAPSLDLARSGWYPSLTAKRAPQDLVERHLIVDGDGVRVRPELARMVSFAQHDLVRDAGRAPGPNGFDVILCRNVLIYYRPEVARLVLDSLSSALAPGGTLFTAPTDELSCRVPEVLERARDGDGHAFRRVTGSIMELATIPDPAPKPMIAVAPAAAPARRPEPDAYAAAIRHQSEGDRRAAERILRELLARTPDHFDALLSLAAIMIERRELDGVQPLIERALAAEPLSPEPTLLLALKLRKQALVRDALGPLRRSAFLDPEFWPASFLLATTWQRLGESTRSRREFEHTLRVLEAVDPEPAQRHLSGLTGLYIDPCQALALCRTQR